MVDKLYNQFVCSKMMLPEHKRALSKYEKENNLKEICRMPELDEQRLMEFERIIQRAIKNGLMVKVTVMTHKGPIEHEGMVEKITAKEIYIEEKMKFNKIKKNKIIKIE